MTTTTKPIRVSLVEYPTPVGKQIDLTGDKVVKSHLPRRPGGTAMCPTFETFEDYIAYRQTALSPRHMFLCGTFEPKHDGATVNHQWSDGPQSISASGAYVAHRPEPGVMRLDTDYKDADEVAGLYPDHVRRFETHAEMADYWGELDPALGAAAKFITDSSSSMIFDEDGTQVSGRRGLHTDIPIDDASQIPRVIETLFKRAWLRGDGWAFVSGGGGVLLRSPIDEAMKAPTQPDYVMPSFVGGRGESRRESTALKGGVLRAADVKALTLAEESRYKELKDSAKRALKDPIQAQRDVVRESTVKRLVGGGMARKKALRVAKAAERKVLLPGQFVDFLEHGRVPVETLLTSEGAKYDKAPCKDCDEPDYPASVWFFYNEGISPVVFGYTHGGVRYMLQHDADAMTAAIKNITKSANEDEREDFLRALGNTYATHDMHQKLEKDAAVALGLGNQVKNLRKSMAEARTPEDGFAPGYEDTAIGTKADLDIFDVAALAFLNDNYGGGSLLLQTRDKSFWKYNDKHWERVQAVLLEAEVLSFLRENQAVLPVVTEKVNSDTAVGRVLRQMGRHATQPGDPLRMLDPHPAVLNLRNGELWLTGDGPELREHSPGSFLTSYTDVAWDPEATAPAFDELLAGILSHPGGAPLRDQREMVRHIKEVMGYGLQPSRFLKTFCLWKGAGDNGKTLLAELVAHLAGGLSGTRWGCVSELATSAFARAKLVGKRMVFEDDAARKAVLDDGFLKTTSESKQVSAQFKFADEFDFRVQVLVFILANHWPATRDLSHGMATRACVIEFKRSFFKEQSVAADHPDRQRPKLTERVYEHELPGVLRELVDGFYRVAGRRGFNEPPSAVRAREDWLKRANSVASFADEHLVKTGGGWKVPRASVWERFKAYCDTNGVPVSVRPGRSGFYERLAEIGFVSVRGQHDAHDVLENTRLIAPTEWPLPGELNGYHTATFYAASSFGERVWRLVCTDYNKAPVCENNELARVRAVRDRKFDEDMAAGGRFAASARAANGGGDSAEILSIEDLI